MRRLRTIALAVIVASGLTAALAATIQVTLAQGEPGERFTICHAAGQAGTTHFVTLVLPREAVFANANGIGGHFFEQGTPQAGHEQDYFGPCRTDTTGTTGTTPTTGTTGTTPIDVCPNIPGNQENVPPGFLINAAGNCVPIPTSTFGTTGSTTTGTTTGTTTTGPGGDDTPPGTTTSATTTAPTTTTTAPPTTTTTPAATTPAATTVAATPTTPVTTVARPAAPTPRAPAASPPPSPIPPAGVPPSSSGQCPPNGAIYQGRCYPKRFGGPVLPGQQG